MRKYLFLAFVCLCLSARLSAQGVSGNLNAQTTDCTVTNACIEVDIPDSVGGATLKLSGTFSATMQFEASGDPLSVSLANANWVALNATPSNSTTAATSATTTGVWQANVAGFRRIRIRVSGYVSGTVAAAINLSTASARAGGGGGGAGGIFGNSNVIDTSAAPYNTPIGNTIPDATFTNGQNTIDCTFSNDCNFSASTDNGKICYGTNMTTDVSILNPTSVVLPEGTLTVTGAQTATCSGGNSTATTVHNGVFVWGKDGAAALNTAYAACIAMNGCDFQLPAGLVLVESAGVGLTDCVKCVEAIGYSRIQVRGWGQVISQLAPTPNFAAANCTGGFSSDQNSCFFGGRGVNFSDMGLWGAGQATLAAGFNGKQAIQFQGGGNDNNYLNNLLLLSWGAATTGFTGIKFEQESAATLHDVHVDGLGSTGCVFTGQFTSTLFTLEGSYCAVNNTLSINVTAGQLTDHGGIHGWTSTAGTAAIECQNVNTFCSFFGTELPYQGGTGNPYYLAAGGGTIRVIGGQVGDGTTNGQAFQLTGASKIFVRDVELGVGITGVYFYCNGSGGALYSEGGNWGSIAANGYILNTIAGCTFYDSGENIYSGTHTPNVNSGTIAGSNDFTGNCTGVVTSAATVGLYGLGQVAATTCTSTTVNLGKVMERSGNIIGLTCTATAGNQAADACTVVKNGVAQTMTCSLNGVTRCTDLTQPHWVSYVKGDVIGIEVIAGTATTLAGVTGDLWRN